MMYEAQLKQKSLSNKCNCKSPTKANTDLNDGGTILTNKTSTSNSL